MEPKRSRRGVVGICGLCGRLVVPAYMDNRKRHTAILSYGSVRVPCHGRVISLRAIEDVP